MNSRAQAGLEYLMTYGWALILVATVIGVLVFVVGNPTNSGIRCTIDDPTSFSYLGIEFPYYYDQDPTYEWWTGTEAGDYLDSKLLLKNLSGGKIRVTGLEVDEGYFYVWDAGGGSVRLKNNTCDQINVGAVEVEIASGEEIELTGISVLQMESSSLIPCSESGQPRAFTKQSGSIIITYKDYASLERQLIISCTGLPPRT